MRLHNLDYLRGLAAVGIMIYHYTSWSIGKFGADTILGRIGVYGVSIFYVLSGLTLYHVYFKKMSPSWNDIKDFFIKRFFRIYPLLWAVIFATVVISLKFPGAIKLLLNVTGLFGFVQWDAYIGTGVWSIGNELVFYTFFPVFILLSKKNTLSFWVFTALLLGIYIYGAFFVLSNDGSLNSQWVNYINPLNQVFLFLGGYLIGYLFEKSTISNWSSAFLIVAGVLVFCFYPAGGDRINLVTDFNRLVFTLACFFICFGFFKLRLTLPDLAHKPLTLLGEASYSIYLLHPLVYSVCGKFGRLVFPGFGGVYQFFISVIVTIVLSYITYEKYEKYFMKKAKNFSTPTSDSLAYKKVS